MNHSFLRHVPTGMFLAAVAFSPAIAAPPRIGDTANDFSLKTPSGETVRLAKLLEKGPVVLVVLRGWPGYQCPICTRQVGELISRSKDFRAAKSEVVLVYPGPAERLGEHAEEFARGKSLPDGFSFVIDPDYRFTHSYGLRWDEPRETAYPSTFIIDARGKIVFAQISRSHGGRAKTSDIVDALKDAQ
jgi:peroxiredoxin Q/BCP